MARSDIVDALEQVIVKAAVHALTDEELEELVAVGLQEPPDYARLNELLKNGWLRSLGLIGYTKNIEL